MDEHTRSRHDNEQQNVGRRRSVASLFQYYEDVWPFIIADANTYHIDE